MADFDFLDSTKEYQYKQYYIDAYQAVYSDESLINYMKTKDIKESFAFNCREECNKIRSNMKLLDEHSGGSCAIVLRAIEYIIKNGFDEWKKSKLEYLLNGD
jgi:hypothetical protein